MNKLIYTDLDVRPDLLTAEERSRFPAELSNEDRRAILAITRERMDCVDYDGHPMMDAEDWIQAYTRYADGFDVKDYRPEFRMTIYRDVVIPQTGEVVPTQAGIADIIQKKYNLHIRKLKSKREVMRSGVAHDIFRLINDAYAPLFGFSRMTERQIDHYVRAYVPVLDLRMVTIVENEQNEIVAVGVSMPSLSRALQKAKGKFFPFGWFHLLKALFWKRPEVLDLLLVGVRPDYQSKGVNALLFTDLIPVYQQLGYKYAESNPELETNDKVQNQWQYFKTEQHKRRRCYKCSL